MLTSGKLLREEREKQNLALEDVERKTRIRKEKLRAVEQSNWEVFPSKTYIIGIIRSYGTFLGLDGDKLVAFFRREYEKKEDMRFKRRVNKHYLTPERKKALIFASTAIISAFALYFGYQVVQYVSPPTIEILSPTKSTFVKEDFITLKGRTAPDSIIEVNGIQIFQEDDATFSMKIPLQPGDTVATIKVTGANGKVSVLKQVYKKGK